MAIVDAEDRIIGILAGCPESKEAWEKVSLEAQKLLEASEAHLRGTKREKDHRRGAFATMRSGISHGGGQTRPMNYHNGPVESEIVDFLNSRPSIRGIAGFGSSKHL
jgi:hypothetical protein